MEEKESDDVVHETVSCPVCGNWVKSIFAHLGKSKQCKQNISPEDLLKFENIRSLKRKLQKREAAANLRKSNPEKSRQEKREAAANFRKSNPEKANEEAKKGMAKIRKLNPEKAKEQARKGMAKHRKLYPEKNKEQAAKHRKLYPEKSKEQAREGMANHRKLYPEKAREQAREGMARVRRVEGEEDRLYRFRVDTLFGPIFVCVSCHQRHFQSNVQIFNGTIREKINKKISLEKCIADMKLTSGPVMKGDDGPKQWICKTCLNSYLLKGKLPSFSVMNGLKLNETTEERKEQGIDLTDFEGSLVSQKLMFQKIFMMPGSRWAGTKDKQILVPVPTDKIQNFLGQLPRTPTEAGLLAVNLKRKLEYKGAHKSQLINPQKIFKFIATCKAAGHPLYQDVSLNMKEFEEKCKASKNDYRLVFGHEDGDGDEDDVDSNENSTDDSNGSDYEKEDSDTDTDIDSKDDGTEAEARQAMRRIIKFNNDVENNRYVMDLQDKFPSIAKLPKVEFVKIGEDEDDDDKNETKDDLLMRSWLNISIFITEQLLEIVDEYDNSRLLNKILDEVYRQWTVNCEKFLVNFFHNVFIEADDHRVVVQEDDYDKESMEELKEKQINLREKFEEKMGIDPVDPKFLLDKLESYSAMEGIEDLNLWEEIISQGKTLGIRWIPPRAFSNDLICDMIDELIEECYK